LGTNYLEEKVEFALVAGIAYEEPFFRIKISKNLKAIFDFPLDLNRRNPQSYTT
jgi:hypothetical protein